MQMKYERQERSAGVRGVTARLRVASPVLIFFRRLVILPYIVRSILRARNDSIIRMRTRFTFSPSLC